VNSIEKTNEKLEAFAEINLSNLTPAVERLKYVFNSLRIENNHSNLQVLVYA